METRTDSTRQQEFSPPLRTDEMAPVPGPAPAISTRPSASLSLRSSPTEQAFRLLHAGFVAAPVIAGLDKFGHRLVNWDKYLAPQVERRLPVSGHTFMQLVGGIEIAAGVLTAVRPRWGGYVVGAWLGGIIGNLLLGKRYYDVALRDFGLMLGAIALGRLADSRA